MEGEKRYDVLLYYGYQVTEDGSVYHAIEAVDPKKKISERRMEKLLAEALDTTRCDDSFDYGSMLVRLPDSVVRRIKEDGVNEYATRLISCLRHKKP